MGGKRHKGLYKIWGLNSLITKDFECPEIALKNQLAKEFIVGKTIPFDAAEYKSNSVEYRVNRKMMLSLNGHSSKMMLYSTK